MFLYFLLYLIVVSVWVLPADKVAEEAGEEELRAQYQCGECHVERGVLAEQVAVDTVAEV